MTINKILISAIFGCSIITQAVAVDLPQPQSTDRRINVVNYMPDNVVPIHGQTFVTTQIQFGKDEIIENVQNGDTAAWEASINQNLPYMMFIKPTAFDSNTNMTVVTNKHTYYFSLTSNKKGAVNAKVNYALKFIYPHQRLAAQLQAFTDQQKADQAVLNAKRHPNDYNWNYSFSGDTMIAPLHVFDDGKFTYFQLQHNQPIPAIFMVNNRQGQEQLVNYRQEGHYLIVERTAPQFTLRLGQHHVTSVFNNTRVAQLNNSAIIAENAGQVSPPLTVMPTVPSAKPVKTTSKKTVSSPSAKVLPSKQGADASYQTAGHE